ncbi:MAG TPA: CHAD domain-containing protein [Verrucomicrobiae bacterium]|nr:CHAD domain-containing protein [Verrucomicrobiae bacterium]
MSRPQRGSWVPAAAEPQLCCDLARATIGPRVRALHQAAGRTAAGGDPAGVHDTRVAARRLRSALGAFPACLDETAREWGAVLRELGQMLGVARDAEVRLERLQELLAPLAVAVDRSDELSPSQGAQAIVTGRTRPASRLDPSGQGHAAQRHLLDRAHQADDEARQAAAAALPTLLPLLGTAPEVRPGHPQSAPAAGLARRCLRRPFRRAGRWKVCAGPTPMIPLEAALHRRRIAIKRLRYGLECFAPVLPRVHRDCLVRLRELQDLLGHHQDLVVLAAWVHDEGQRAQPLLRPALRRQEVRIAHAARGVAGRAVAELERLDAAGYWPSASAACRLPLAG